MSRRPFPTIRRAASALPLVTFLFALAPDAAHSAPPTPKTISMAEARSLPLGTVVTVDGSVTVPSGAFSSSTFDQGFAIQDRTDGMDVSVFLTVMWGLPQESMFASTRRPAESFGSLVLVGTPRSDI